MTTATEETTEVQPVQPAEAEPSSLFGYAMWVHVGAGAEECDQVDEREGTNQCTDGDHFHVWCRLPNQFQSREIREAAQAAKARIQRQLRTEGTNVNEILENGIADILAEPDATERMANELIGYDWTNDYIAAVSEVRELEDDSEDAEEGDRPYQHIDDDRGRYLRLRALPEEEREGDEWTELKAHIAKYEITVKAHYDSIANPKRESYLLMADDELATLVRRKRIELRAHEEFMHHYSTHEWLACTHRDAHDTTTTRFPDLETLQAERQPVLRALSEAFADLERTAQEAQGN